MNYSTRAINGIFLNLSLFTLMTSATSSAAFADPFQQAATADFNGAAQSVGSSSSVPCPGEALPDAPSATKAASKVQNALTYLKIGVFGEVTKGQSKDGPVSLNNETLSATIALGAKKLSIRELMLRSGVPPIEEPDLFLMNVNVMVAPAAGALVGTAEAQTIQNIQATDGQWDNSGEIKNAHNLAHSLRGNALKQLTVSAAIVTKSGKIYMCEAGKSPVSFIPADSTNGSANGMENATGGPSDGLDVGSAFSTAMAQCTLTQSLKNFSKFTAGVEAHKGTRDDGGDLNRLFANAFFSNVVGNNANKLGLPNTFTAKANLTENIGNAQVVLNSTAGATSVLSNEYFIYDVNGQVAVKDTKMIFNYGKNTTTSPTGSDPNIPSTSNYAVNRTGALAGIVSPSRRNFRAYATAERDTNVTDVSNATTSDGIIKLKKVATLGVNYTHETVYNPEGDLLSSHQGSSRIILGVSLSDTRGYVKSTGFSVGFHGILESSGSWKDMGKALGDQLKHPFPKKDNARVSTSEAYCSDASDVDHSTIARCTPAKDEKAPAAVPETATNP